MRDGESYEGPCLGTVHEHVGEDWREAGRKEMMKVESKEAKSVSENQ